MKVVGCLAIVILILLGARIGLAESPAVARANVGLTYFDPARHMRVSEVRPGMTGYGLSVFKGTKIERFEVEVLSILRNFNPKYDVVLIRCKGDFLEHTGSIAGMSGSPIFLRDERGRERMIGAFAYGWPMTKDPIAGVQPIEYMLDLPRGPAPAETTTQPASAGAGARETDVPTRLAPSRRTSWSMKKIAIGLRGLPAGARAEPLDSTAHVGERARGGMMLDGDGQTLPRLAPLTTPIMVSGMSPRTIDLASPAFASMGVTLLQSGGGSAATQPAAVQLEPGSVLAVPLLTGDTDMTAVGTCTEVLGDQFWGFGHPFNNEGAIALPMGAGEIQGVVANLQTSFKLGSISGEIGTLTMDGAVGVAGKLGATPPMIPIDFHVTAADGTPVRSYHFDGARHSKFTPLLAGMAFSSALTGGSDLPQFNTVDYDLAVEFTNGEKLRILNRAANTSPNDLFNELGIPMTAASDNPFQQVLGKADQREIKISSEARAAQLMDVTVPKSKYRPGETLKAFATYKPFHGAEAILPISLELPKDLAAGPYQLVISDAQRYVTDEAQSQPFRFLTENIYDVFGVLKDLIAIRDNALYVRLIRQPDGVAVGRTALAKLPSSRRQILLGGGHSDTTPFVSSIVKSIATDDVMSGSAEFVITIDTSPKVALGGPRPKGELNPPATKPEEPKRAPGSGPSGLPGHAATNPSS